jgi:two-component system cell cycle response regulator DivK
VRRILVVEDNERSRKLARVVLEHADLEVEAVGSGAEALRTSIADPPALVLLDVQLPDIEGPEVLLRLRQDPRTAGVPVVALTAFAMAGDEERLRGAGFDGYLTKPIDVTTFAATVRGMLDGYGSP